MLSEFLLLEVIQTWFLNQSGFRRFYVFGMDFSGFIKLFIIKLINLPKQTQFKPWHCCAVLCLASNRSVNYFTKNVSRGKPSLVKWLALFRYYAYTTSNFLSLLKMLSM